MKNFRKVLALVLVVATLFSFTAMTSAAYEDADKISYKQAVDVLSKVGVLDGYEVAKDEFEFHPTDKITREEMAKMIAVMCNAGDDISKLYASACNFADVAKDRWSASYVAYCAKTGIVAGRSASTFDPTANVTGLETAKMLLVALGFDPKIQGYTGADWKVNVIREVKNLNLLKGFAASYDIEVAITREEAAQMMLNALMSKVVIGYLSDAARVVVTNKAYAGVEGLEWTLVDAKGIATLMYGKVVVSETTLWEALYGGKLSDVEGARDCFGRPSAGWTWTDAKGKTTTIGAYPAAPVWSSADTTATAVDKEIKTYTGITNPKYSVGDAYVDGVKTTWAKAQKEIGNGTQVELYIVGEKIEVVIINTYFGYVGCANAAKGTVEILKADKTSTAGSIANTFGYRIADEGTAVAYQLCSKNADYNTASQQIHGIEELTPEVITLHALRKNLAEFDDVEENIYEANFTATDVLTYVDANLGTKAYIWTDANGFVLGIAPVAGAKNVSVLVGTSAYTDTLGQNNYGTTKYAYTAKFVEFEAGAKASDALAITEKMKDADSSKNTSKAKYDVLVKWAENALGQRAGTGADGAVEVATRATAKDLRLKAESGQIIGLGLVGTTDTQYILRLMNASTGLYEYKYFDGCDKIDANYVLNDLQYFTATTAHYGERTLTYVYADASKVYAPSVAFVLSHYTNEKYKEVGGAEVEYELFNAIINGEEAYVAYEKDGLLPDLAKAVAGKTADKKVVYKAVTSSYYKVIAETHNDKPIYIAEKVETASAGHDFLVIGDLLTFLTDDKNVLTSKPLAEGANVVVITDYLDTNTKYTDDVVILDDYADLELYLQAHGWSTKTGEYYAYIQTNTAGAVTNLYLYVKEAA